MAQRRSREDGDRRPAYLLFIQTAKRRGRWRPSPDTVNATLVVEPYRRFMHQSQPDPDPDLLRLDIVVAGHLGAFLRHPTPYEMEAAGIDEGDLLYIQHTGDSLDYRIVRPEPGQRVRS